MTGSPMWPAKARSPATSRPCSATPTLPWSLARPPISERRRHRSTGCSGLRRRGRSLQRRSWFVGAVAGGQGLRRARPTLRAVPTGPRLPCADRHPARWAPNRIPAELTETAFLVERFGRWVERQDGPWCAHLSFIAAHPPYTTSVGYLDRYSADHGPTLRRLPDREAERAVQPLAAIAIDSAGCPVDEAETRQLRATFTLDLPRH
jgi:hypothetical protein